MCRSVSRQAVSLLEVLVAIFVLTIGLLSVSTLIPAGQSQVMKSLVEDRKLAVAEQAIAELNARGYLTTYIDTTVTPNRVATQFKRVDTSTGNLVTLYADQLTSLGAFAIDPLSILNNSPLTTVAAFPYDVDTTSPALTPTMTRVTLRMGTGAITLPIARENFFNDDDLTFEVPADPELSPTGGFAEDTASNPLRRYSDTRYSWVYTLEPQFHVGTNSSGLPEVLPTTLYRASAVIFRNREFPLGSDDDNAPLERAVSGQFLDVAPSGGSIQLTAATEDELKNIKPGSWVLIGGHHRRSVPLAPISVYEWYRVQSVDDEIQHILPADVYQLEIAVTGETWQGRINPNSGLFPNLPSTVTCSFFTGIETVKTVSLNLEQSSQWNQ